MGMNGNNIINGEIMGGGGNTLEY